MSTHGGSAFMAELLSVVANELALVGVEATTHTGSYPSMETDTVYVVIPHEYFVVTPTEFQPTAEQRKRTIAFCVEHPGNATFEVSIRYAQLVGAAMDINASSQAEMERRGVPTESFKLGYSKSWDAWGGNIGSERPIDITYLGTTDPRRNRLLSKYSRLLESYDTAYLIPPHEPMVAPRDDFLMGKAKLRHLASSRVLLNLHRGASDALEWVRVLEAICNGCVVISERSRDVPPLVPGEHIVLGRGELLGIFAKALLEDADRQNDIRASAYSFVKNELTMAASAERLITLAEKLIRSYPLKNSYSTTPIRSAVDKAPRPVLDVSFPFGGCVDPANALAYETVCDRIGATSLNATVTEWDHPQVDGGRPRVDAILASTRGTSVTDAVDSLKKQTFPIRIVCGETDSPSLGALRNRLIRGSDAEYLFILDPVHACFPDAIARLIQEATNSGLPAAYSMVSVRNGGLLNCHPIEIERLTRIAYLEGPLLIKRDLIERMGGYAEEPELIGLEDHDMYCRLADAKVSVRFVKQILSERSLPEPRLEFIRPIDIEPLLSWRLLRRRSALLFAGQGLLPEATL